MTIHAASPIDRIMQEAWPTCNGDVATNLCAAMTSDVVTSCMILHKIWLGKHTAISPAQKDPNINAASSSSCSFSVQRVHQLVEAKHLTARTSTSLPRFNKQDKVSQAASPIASVRSHTVHNIIKMAVRWGLLFGGASCAVCSCCRSRRCCHPPLVLLSTSPPLLLSSSRSPPLLLSSSHLLLSSPPLFLSPSPLLPVHPLIFSFRIFPLSFSSVFLFSFSPRRLSLSFVFALLRGRS